MPRENYKDRLCMKALSHVGTAQTPLGRFFYPKNLQSPMGAPLL
jgi:hypothetical protein